MPLPKQFPEPSDVQFPPGFPAGKFLNPPPAGVVVPWFGSIQDIPEGYVLSDGNNGTQDMRSTIPKATTSESSVGNTEGSDSVTLSESNIPSHTHGDTSSLDDSDHTHDIFYDLSAAAPDTSGSYGVEPDGQSYMDPAGSHSHSDSESATGSGNALDNRPSYVGLHMIEKV